MRVKLNIEERRGLKKALVFAGLIFICSLVSLFVGCRKNQEPQPVIISTHVHGIIPLPAKSELLEGSITVDENIVLVNNPAFSSAVSLIENALKSAFNKPVVRKDNPGNSRYIKFSLTGNYKLEEYSIEIGPENILIEAGTAAAAFYAAQSLCQMIWNATSGTTVKSFDLRQMNINDSPAYSWRGFHLDISRHTFTRDYLEKVIDWMAYYKLNKLHLHLTDDQGWRIAIDKYPLLTEKGAWRDFNSYDSTCMELAKANPFFEIDPRFIKVVDGKEKYGGSFSKEELQEIIEFASDRFVEIIPEIDMPGHMSAAIGAYPFLSCTDSAGWGNEFSIPICPCNQEVMDFAFSVWDEVLDLFPSKYVHIGCDEVETSSWEASPVCQAFMQQENMNSVKEIENYFVKQLQYHLESKGKKVIAWDDVIDGNVDENLVMMYWRNWVTDSPSRCAANGNSIILTPAYPFYLASVTTDQALEDLYNYSPKELYGSTILNKIQGMQTCLWTEIVPSESRFEQLVFPRLQALSEVCWSDARDWNSFKLRMKSHFSYMNKQNIHYSRPGWMY